MAKVHLLFAVLLTEEHLPLTIKIQRIILFIPHSGADNSSFHCAHSQEKTVAQIFIQLSLIVFEWEGNAITLFTQFSVVNVFFLKQEKVSLSKILNL